MATSTQERDSLRSFRRAFEGIRGDVDSAGDVYGQAVEKFLTAAGYRDDTLMRSALEEAKAARRFARASRGISTPLLGESEIPG